MIAKQKYKFVLKLEFWCPYMKIVFINEWIIKSIIILSKIVQGQKKRQK